jgi:hypothetical protein
MQSGWMLPVIVVVSVIAAAAVVFVIVALHRRSQRIHKEKFVSEQKLLMQKGAANF